MENLSQYAQIGIVAGAFLIGCLLTWLIGRSARRQIEAGYTGRLQSAQAALKRREDDLQTVRAQLTAQRDRAEQLAAERAAFQAKWEQARAEAAARIEELESALAQEREERDQARAETARVSEVSLEAEPDEPDDAAALPSPPEVEDESPAAEPQSDLAEDAPSDRSQGSATEQASSSIPTPAREAGKLAEAKAKIASLSESVSALSAIAAQLAAALDQRDRELAAVRSRLGRAEPPEASDEAEDDRSQLMAQLHARDAEVDALHKLLGQVQDEAYKLADEKIGLETQLQAREAEFNALNILLGQVHSESDKLADAKADLEALLQARDAEILALNEDLEQTLAEAMRTEAERTPPARASASGAAPDVAGHSPSKAAALQAAWTLGAEPGGLAQPQDLNEVTGIGAIFEQRLFAAGVGTYWELANLSDAEMQRILQVDDVRQLRAKPDEIRAEAYRLAQETNTVGRVWTGDTDDHIASDDDEVGDEDGDDDAQDEDAVERRT